MKPKIDLMTVEEVAQAFSISRKTLYEWIKKGELPPPFKIGRSSRWRVKDIEDHIAKREKTARQGTL